MIRIVFILLFLPTILFAQSKARSTVSVTIINIADTANYKVEQAVIKDAPTIKKGDTKEYLLITFEAPDARILMPNRKEKWVYGNIAVYINDGKVDLTQMIKWGHRPK